MDVPLDGWLTLTEAAAHTGHTREAIRQRIRRGSLPASKGNDGQLRVQRRDLADLPPPDATTDDHGQPRNATRDATADVPLVSLADLRMTVDDLRTTLVVTLDKALADQGRAEQAEARADQAEAREREARALADQRGADMTAALMRAARAEGEATALREALTEARRPAWRRWLGLN